MHETNLQSHVHTSPAGDEAHSQGNQQGKTMGDTIQSPILVELKLIEDMRVKRQKNTDMAASKLVPSCGGIGTNGQT